MNEHKSIKNWAEDERPREKLINLGPKSLTQAELLAILISSGNKRKSALDIAREILADCDNKIDNLCKLSYSDLLKYEAIGEAKAVTIAAAVELGRRRENIVAEQLHSSQDIFAAIAPKVIDESRELAYVIYLNNSNRIIKVANVGVGGIDKTLVDIRIVIGEALRLNAVALALVHNHPSGNMLPSKEDDALTRSMYDACSLMNIRFVDHVIISGNGQDYYSYHDKGRV
ncbi:MAG: DNA repair protein RadC [Bacteroidales bacterium]|nr:DNA repair protein RadC [Bacteroidales bacterium]